MPARSGGFRRVNSVDVVPTHRLELEPVVVSRLDVDVLLQELAYLGSIVQTANAVRDAKIRLATAEAAKRLFTEIDGKDVAIADRRQALEAELDRVAAQHPELIFSDGSKTAAFNFGTLSLRAAPRSLGYLEGETPKSVLEKIEAKWGLRKKLDALLASLRIFRRPSDTFVRAKLEVNIADMKAAALEGKLSDEQLAQLGLALSEPRDRLSIEVRPWQAVESQSCEPAA